MHPNELRREKRTLSRQPVFLYRRVTARRSEYYLNAGADGQLAGARFHHLEPRRSPLSNNVLERHEKNTRRRSPSPAASRSTRLQFIGRRLGAPDPAQKEKEITRRTTTPYTAAADTGRRRESILIQASRRHINVYINIPGT